MSPKQIVQKWIEAFNRKDISTLAECYLENAVNHQTNTEPLYGREAIKKCLLKNLRGQKWFVS